MFHVKHPSIRIPSACREDSGSYRASARWYVGRACSPRQ